MVAPAAQVGDHHSAVGHDCRGRGVAELARTLAGPADFPNETAIGTHEEDPVELEHQAVEYQQVAGRVEGHVQHVPELFPFLAGESAEPVEFLELQFQRAVLGGKLDGFLGVGGNGSEQARTSGPAEGSER